MLRSPCTLLTEPHTLGKVHEYISTLVRRCGLPDIKDNAILEVWAQLDIVAHTHNPIIP